MLAIGVGLSSAVAAVGADAEVAARRAIGPEQEPPATIDAGPEDERIETRIRELLDFSVDHWIKRARLSGPLFYYTGDLTDHRLVVKYLIQEQRVADPGNPEIDYRAGAWTGDNYTFETFDEGGHGRAMLVLATALDAYGNIWSFNHPSGVGQRDMLMALESAVQCALLNQFQERHQGFPASLGWYGIPGPWPQSPGWRTGEAKFTTIAGLRTFNDFATSGTVMGLVGARLFLPEYEQLIDESVALCGVGTRLIQERNHGGLPEQCDPWGIPVWGRGHEPPSISPRSTGFGLQIYMAAHALDGDPKWLTYIFETADWLVQTNLGDDTWEHYLEPSPTLPPGQWAPVWGDGEFNPVLVREAAAWPSAEFGSLVTSPHTVLEALQRYLDEVLCIADMDGDGDTDVFDFTVFVTRFGGPVVPGTSGDYDGDGDVDVLDFTAMASEFGCAE